MAPGAATGVVCWQRAIPGIPWPTPGRGRGLVSLGSDEDLIPAPVLPAVGRLLIEFTSPMPLERVQRENPGVLLGGRYTPPDCTPAQTVAVIIPFRHREHHLRYWLHYLHPILRRQRLRYGIYVINQVCSRSLQAGHRPPGDPRACWCICGVGGIHGCLNSCVDTQCTCGGPCMSPRAYVGLHVPSGGLHTYMLMVVDTLPGVRSLCCG